MQSKKRPIESLCDTKCGAQDTETTTKRHEGTAQHTQDNDFTTTLQEPILEEQEKVCRVETVQSKVYVT